MRNANCPKKGLVNYGNEVFNYISAYFAHQKIIYLYIFVSLFATSVRSVEVPKVALYTGIVSAVEFNKDGSFYMQLINDKKLIEETMFECIKRNTFLVRDSYQYNFSKELIRMREDVREAFFNSAKSQISISVYGCSGDAEYPLVKNILLGPWQQH